MYVTIFTRHCRYWYNYFQNFVKYEACLLGIYGKQFDSDEERRIRDEQERIQSIRDELKDKTMRINELEVSGFIFSTACTQNKRD